MNYYIKHKYTLHKLVTELNSCNKLNTEYPIDKLKWIQPRYEQ